MRWPTHMTLWRVAAIQAGVVAIPMLAILLVVAARPSYRPAEWIFLLLLVCIPGALIFSLAKFKSMTRNVAAWAMTLGWALLACYGVLLLWVNTYGS